MYFLIITFGFLLAVRGTRSAPLQKPEKGLENIGRDAVDFFLSTSLVLALWAIASVSVEIQTKLREYAILGTGLTAYLISRYQKRTDVFFLSVVASVFMISSRYEGFSKEIFLAGIVSAGIAIFQVCLLGLRYKLLFSRVPTSMRGWPILCLLAAVISMILGGLGRLVF